jgi:hypothetical protein
VDAVPVAQEAVASATAAVAVSAPARRSRQSFPSAMVPVSSFEIVTALTSRRQTKSPSRSRGPSLGVELHALAGR